MSDGAASSFPKPYWSAPNRGAAHRCGSTAMALPASRPACRASTPSAKARVTRVASFPPLSTASAPTGQSSENMHLNEHALSSWAARLPLLPGRVFSERIDGLLGRGHGIGKRQHLGGKVARIADFAKSRYDRCEVA